MIHRDYAMENDAIVATDLTKWFGEGEARMTAVKGVGLVAHFGEMLFIVGHSSLLVVRNVRPFLFFN